ncbi:hypothetical protein [Altericista sp. CCNU0014]|uniref:hypothetical protein n=1 Tax=Altericista sp. CCNU0014 TaxID=3082949 RepID=UPI00384D98CF
MMIMKRLLATILTCFAILLSACIPNVAQAHPLEIAAFPALFSAEAVDVGTDLLKKFETEILPQLESALSPAQRDQFDAAIADGTSFRKAFKALTLSAEQKAQVGTLLKSLPKKEFFASLTPDQKQQLFLKKKDLFKPTPEEIGEKISAKMKVITDKNPFAPTGAEIGEKISAKMKMVKEKAAQAMP